MILNVNNRKKIGIIFDMDGVIIDTCSLHEQSWFIISQLNHFEWDKTINFKKDVFGASSVDSIKLLFKEKLGMNDIDELCKKKCEIHKDLLHKNVQNIVTDGFLVFFEKVVKKDIPLALATSSNLYEASFVLKSLGIYDCFKKILTISDVTHPKPHPEVYLKANQSLGLPINHCIGFEDSVQGIQSIENAGIACVVVGSTLSEERLIDSDMKYELYINNFAEITIENIMEIFDKKSLCLESKI